MSQKTNPIIDKLFSVGAHFGYAARRRHPSQVDVIFGTKGGMELIDLEKSAARLEEALQFIRSLAAERKTILFVGGKPEAREALKRVAERLGAPYVDGRWIGGSLTNFSEIRKRLNRLADLSEKREKGELAQFTKKERLLIDREISNLEEMFGGIRSVTRTPDALVVIDPRQESGSVDEARHMNIPVVALMNTDCDRAQVQYPIPGNDASRQTIAYVLEEIGNAYAESLGPERTPQQAEVVKA